MSYEIKVEKDKCIGCQNCVNVCPSMFRMKGDKAEPIKKKADAPGCANQAKSECPSGAITVKQV